MKTLSPEYRGIVEKLYQDFCETWGGSSSNDMIWMGVWGQVLSSYDRITIEHVSEFVRMNWPKQPVLAEFRILCDRLLASERLTEPIEFETLKIAKHVLSVLHEDLCSTSCSNVSDALLIAATISSIIENEGVGIEWTKGIADISLKDRIEMFQEESFEWLDEARNGKGYWYDILTNGILSKKNSRLDNQ